MLVNTAIHDKGTVIHDKGTAIHDKGTLEEKAPVQKLTLLAN